jgi:ubiquinone biosynthesis protein Coq4
VLEVFEELKAIGIRSPWSALQSARNFALTVWDPRRSDIRQGVNALIYGALRDPSAERIRHVTESAPALAALYEEGYDPELDVDELLTLSDGTLGREYARFIRDNGIDPLGDLLELERPKNVLEYGFRRAYKLHDVLHVVLGCDTSILGEVRIVSFSVGQAKNDDGRAAALALAVLLLHLTLRRPQEFKEAIRLADEWQGIGERSPLYTTFRLEDLVAEPVAAVRARMLPS